MNAAQEVTSDAHLEKVLAFYLDGIPMPFIEINPDVAFGETFGFSSFGIRPDYTGETELVEFPEYRESPHFSAICLWKSKMASPSSRIGSHFSPYVGTFCASGKEHCLISLLQIKRRSLRIPLCTCIKKKSKMSQNGNSSLSLILELYEELSKKYIFHDRESLRRIVILATQGVPSDYKYVVETTILEIKKMYLQACSRAIYEYLDRSSLFRRMMAPLCLRNFDATSSGFCGISSQSDYSLCGKFEGFGSSLSFMQNSLLWGTKTRIFFLKLQNLWINHFEKLAIFNTTTTNWLTSANDYLFQLSSSLRAAFTRIRIEFYTQTERILFSVFPDYSSIMMMSAKKLRDSDYWRLFLAARVFLTNRIRELVHDSLADLVLFFSSGGESIISPAAAKKISLIEVSLVVGGSGLPTSPTFAELRFGVADLLDELIDTANGLPTPEVVIMRTLDFERQSLDMFTTDNLPCKASLIKYFNAAGIVVEDLISKYSCFANLPSVKGLYFTRVPKESIVKHINILQEGISNIKRVSPDIVFCGCFAINCSELKKWYTKQWSSYLESFLVSIQKDLLSSVRLSVEKCRQGNDRLRVEPNNVEELEKLQSAITYAESLSKQVENSECKEILECFNCLENLFVPIDSQLYETAVELMRCPGELSILACRAKEICFERKPFMNDKLIEYRSTIHEKIVSMRKSVTGLLDLFSVDVSDVCTHTCRELRVVADEITKSIEYVFFCEKILQIEQVDSFEVTRPLLRMFDVLEQFWSAVFDSTLVKDYYSMPVNSINTVKVMDNVRRCRRLLHSATRSLRAYPGLLQLGRQQEHALAEFESLETLLTYITSSGLRKNQWKEIGRVIGSKSDKNLQIDSNTTLKLLLEKGITDHIEELKLIVIPARMDFESEDTLGNIKNEAQRTRFVFKNSELVNDVSVLSPQCMDDILILLESFLVRLRFVRQRETISPYVLNAVRELEGAVDKTRRTLLMWANLEKDWIEMMCFNKTLAGTDEDSIPAYNTREWKFINEKLGLLNAVFKGLATTLQKPQYTLFTAMFQENIQDQLNIANGILGDIKDVVLKLLDAKREIFPRLYFLNDESMLLFLSVTNVSKLRKFLTFLYDRVCDVGFDGNIITSFITVDGAVLKADTPLTLSPLSSERWLNLFDETLRSSFIREIRSRVETHYHSDTMTWLRDSCVQIIDVSLRIICYRDLREALSVGGLAGVKAFMRRLRDLLEEFIRLANASLEMEEERVLVSAITLLLNLLREVKITIKSGVETIEDLDSTGMLQTLMENDEIYIQTLGFRFSYGMEFLGNYSLPILTPEYVEKSLYSVLLSFKALYWPIMVYGANESSRVEFCAHFAGRFCWTIQCHQALTVDCVLRGLRGCLGIGAVFCLWEIDRLKKDIVKPISELLQCVKAAYLSAKNLGDDCPGKIEIDFGDSTVRTPVTSGFHVILTARQLSEIPTPLSLAFRPIYVPSVDLALLAETTLQAFGIAQCVSLGQRLATMYSQFMEISPTVFNPAALLSVIKDAAACIVGTLAENICLSFLRRFWCIFQSNEQLTKLLEWNVVHTLGIPQDVWDDVLGHFEKLSEFNGLLERFTYIMKFHVNVLLVGSAFSKATCLWRQWVGDSHYVVIPFNMLSVEEVYGNVQAPGLISSLVKQWNPLESHTIILEETTNHDASAIFDIPMLARVRSKEGVDFIKGPSTRVIAIVTSLTLANPTVMNNVVLFTVPEPSSWRELLSDSLRREPSFQPHVGYRVMSALIDSIIQVGILQQTSVQCKNVLSAICRSSHFYKRWYEYAQSHSENVEDAVHEVVFAIQCAIFATCWSIGLGLPREDYSKFSIAIEGIHDVVSSIAEEFDLHEDNLLPSGGDILDCVATPLGWKKIGSDLVNAGFDSPWANKVLPANIQQRTWTHFFSFPSRQAPLVKLEHLIMAGQPVLLVGGRGQGKSTILRHLSLSSRWAHTLVHNTPASRAAYIQEVLLRSLLWHKSRGHAPATGQNIVLCVDDVHLSETRGDSQPLSLFAFIHHHAALCIPTEGYVPIAGVRCVGVASSTSRFREELERTVIRLRLPDFDDTEILAEVHKLFEKACGTRRGLNFAKDVRNLLAAAQQSALNIVYLETTTVWPGNSQVGASENSNQLEGKPYRLTYGYGTSESAHLSCLHMFFRVADKVLRVLLCPLDEKSMTKSILDSVYTFYSSMMREEKHREMFEKNLVATTSKHMSNNVPFSVRLESPDEGAAADVVNDSELLTCSREAIKKLAVAYETAVMTRAIVDFDDLDRSDTIIMPATTSEKLFGSQNVKTEALYKKKLPGSVSRYTSSWMVSVITDFHQSLRQDAAHIAFIGPHSWGIRRALGLWATAVRANLAFLRNDFSGPDAQKLFSQDLSNIVQRTLRSGSKTVVFIPHSVVLLAWPLNYMYTVLRGGDLKQLLSVEEQLYLLHGRRTVQRADGRLTTAEEAKLRSRILNRLSIVTHIFSYEEMRELDKSMPLVSFLLPVSLRPSLMVEHFANWLESNELRYYAPVYELDASRGEMGASSSLGAAGQSSASSQRMPESRNFCCRPSTEVLCKVFELLKSSMDIHFEQFLEFVAIAQKLRAVLTHISMESSRLMKIADLPNAISAKMQEYEVSGKEALETEKSVKRRCTALLARISELEASIARYNEERSALADALGDLETALDEEESKIRAKEDVVNGDLALAMGRLSSVRAAHVRQLSLLPPPLRGTVLVKAVCKVLDEEIPPVGPKDQWEHGKKIMTAPKFISRIKAVVPSNLQYASFASIHAALREVRLNDVSPFAAILAECIVAIMDVARVAGEVRESHTKLEDIRSEHAVKQSEFDIVQGNINMCSGELASLRAEVQQLEVQDLMLETLIADLDQRRCRLEQLLDMVDRFSSFCPTKDILNKEDEERAEGAIILFAANSAFFAAHPPHEQMRRIKVLSSIFCEMGITAPDNLDESAVLSLFPSVRDLADSALASLCTCYERQYAAAVLQRVHFNWLFFGGVNPAFEGILRQCLDSMCGECAVLSAQQQNFSEKLLSALNSGAGILLCDVDVSFLEKNLCSFLALREAMHEAMWYNKSVKWSLQGSQIEIRPTFYMVFCSTVIVPVEDAIRALPHRITVINFYRSIGVEDGSLMVLLRSHTASNSRHVNDIFGTFEKNDAETIKTFRQTIPKASVILSESVDTLACNDGGMVDRLDAILRELHTLHTTTLCILARHKQVQKPLLGSWSGFRECLNSVDRALHVIESDILGRNWTWLKLEPLILTAAELSQPYLSRILPNVFDSLPWPQKEFYATVNFVERTVKMLACGWPTELRGIFAWYILSNVVHDCQFISGMKGVLYHKSVFIHSNEQHRVLNCLMNRRGKVLDRDGVRRVYSESSDNLLQSIAVCTVFSEESPASHSSSTNSSYCGPGDDSRRWAPKTGELLAHSLFTEWMQLNYAACDEVASVLYDAFFFAVKKQGVSQRTEAASPYARAEDHCSTIRYTEEWVQYAKNMCIPVLLSTSNAHDAAMTVRQRARVEQMSYQYCCVSDASSIVEFVTTASRCLQYAPCTQARGHCIMLTIQLPDSESERYSFMKRLTMRFKQLYSYAVWGPLRHDNFFFVPTAIFCTLRSDSNVASEPYRRILEEYCFTLAMDTASARHHVLTLLEDSNIFLPWKRDGASLVLEVAPGKLSNNIRALRRQKDNSALVGVRLKNVIELHAGLAAGLEIQRIMLDSGGFGDVLRMLHQSTVNLEDLTIILRLMSLWLQRKRQFRPSASGVRRFSASFGLSRVILTDDDVGNASIHSRSEVDITYTVFNKIAYGVYTARVGVVQGRIVLSDMLRERGAGLGSKGDRSAYFSMAMDDAAHEGASLESIFSSLRRTEGDFFILCGDTRVVEVYRANVKMRLEKTLYGSTGVERSTTASGSFMDPILELDECNDSQRVCGPDSISNNPLLFVVRTWEKDSCEKLVVALESAGCSTLASRLKLALRHLLSWCPGSALNLWLPALQHPRLVVNVLWADSLNKKIDGFSQVEAVLVVLERFRLLHDDVVLTGAALSSPLEQDVLANTSWSASSMVWNKEAGAKECEKDVVVALRFQRTYVESDVRSPSEVLWDLRVGDKRPDGRLLHSRQNSVVFLTSLKAGNAPVIEVRSTTPVPVIGIHLPSAAVRPPGERNGLGGISDCEWCHLLELPLCVIACKSDGIGLRNKGPRSPAMVQQSGYKLTRQSSTRLLRGPAPNLNDSMGFFVAIS
ncbi:hypothetical protein TRVL_04993 [Trypanosoma vivax]|nr:hypothetical protein TRVL_04993 [Trypanosoma vivax]